MRRYLRLFWVQLRASMATSMQYRVDFIVDGFMSLWWMVWTLVPLWVVFSGRGSVAGWTWPEALLVAACFTILRGVLEGAVTPALVQIGEQIRTGTLDFVLIKPADAQFLVSTSKFAPWKVVDLLAGGVMIGYAFHALGRTPGVLDVAVALALLGAAVLVLYALWILVVSLSFWVVRLDNLQYLLGSIFDAGRWPLDIFPRAWRLFFTYLIPLALMTTFPARAMLGKLPLSTAALALLGAVAFGGIARMVWRRAIGHYTSASS